MQRRLVSNMNPLKKKGNTASLQGKQVAPMQPVGKQPATSLTNDKFEDLNNTKHAGSPMNGAKSHAKVMGASPTKHGRYL